MNSFNRLLSSYIDLFLIEKILYNYNRKNAQKFCVSKKMPIFVIQKKNNKTYSYGRNIKNAKKI